MFFLPVYSDFVAPLLLQLIFAKNRNLARMEQNVKAQATVTLANVLRDSKDKLVKLVIIHNREEGNAPLYVILAH